MFRRLPQCEAKFEMNRSPTNAKTLLTMKSIPTGRIPGLDGLPFELLKVKREKLLHAAFDLIIEY